jgi:methylglutamate dehydrogenase subunit D
VFRSTPPLAIAPRSPLQVERTEAAGRSALSIIDRLTIAHVAARRDQSDAVAAALLSHLGLKLPVTPKLVSSSGISAVWCGPGQWLIMAPDSGGRDLESELLPLLSSIAAVTDQSDSRTLFAMAGPDTPDVLAKVVPIDLHGRFFQPGDVAITHAAHIGTLLWRAETGEPYVLACSRSYAASLWHYLTDAGAQPSAKPPPAP